MTSRKHQLLANLERSMPSLRHIRQMHAWVEQQKAAVRRGWALHAHLGVVGNKQYLILT